jgi:osmotically-inducible protein OsmY
MQSTIPLTARSDESPFPRPTAAGGRPGLLLVLALIFAALVLGACSDVPKRSKGTVLDDQTLEYSVINTIYSHPNFSDADHIKVEVYEGVVLLVGETVSEENRELATKLAAGLKLTRRVVNDLKVSKRTSFAGQANNAWLTAKINAILVQKNVLPGFDATRIKVVSSEHQVYLMGLVSHEQGDAIAEIVRNIRGVEKVIKIFDYTD